MNRYVMTAILICAAMLGGCSNNSEDKYALVLGCESSYYEKVAKGFAEEMELLGKQVVVQAPQEMSVSEQYQILQKLRDEKLDGIAVMPNSSASLNYTVEEYAQDGIPVIAVGSGINTDNIFMEVFAFDCEDLARELLEKASDFLGGSGQIAVLSTTNQEPISENIISNMRSLLEKGTYPGIILTEIAYGNNDMDRSIAKMQHLNENYPDLKLVLTLSSEATMAAAEYITMNDLEGCLYAAGYGLPEDIGEYPGSVIPFYYTYDPEKLGKISALVLETAAERDGNYYKAGDKLNFEGMGEYEVFDYSGTYATEGAGSSYPGIIMENEITWIENQ